jgi:hypothetical protein
MADLSANLTPLVRIGFFARAVLYVLLGLIALTGAQSVAAGTDGIFRTINEAPLGKVVLGVLAVGLAAYGLFRLASLVFDIEHQGSDGKGWAKRIGHGASAAGHFLLAWTAVSFLRGGGNAGGDGTSAATAGVLSAEFGGVVIGLIGLAFCASAIAQAAKGFSGSFIQRIAPDAPRATRAIGGAGYIARAVVFLVIGWSLIEAGFLSRGAGNVKTLGEAVAALAETGWLFTLVAIGLVLFGLFSAVLARWRIIPKLATGGRAPARPVG